MATNKKESPKVKTVVAPYFLGEKKVQVGKLAGVHMPGFILISEHIREKIGLPVGSGLPRTVGGIPYRMQHGSVIAKIKATINGTVQEIDRLVRVKRGSKAVKLHLQTTEPYTFRRQGKVISGTRHVTVQVGVPSWATVKQVHDFFVKALQVKSFSMGGGIHTITRSASPTGGK